MAKKTDGHSPELDALLRSNRLDVAARLLVVAFEPIVDDHYPYLTGARLGDALARVAGVPISGWTWSIRRNPDAQLARLVLEAVLLWERAGLACRGLAIDANEVVLLERGAELLRSGVEEVHRVLREAAFGP